MNRSSLIDTASPLIASRRHLLQGAASLALWSLLPGRAIAGTRDPRLLVVVLRGALDGLALAAPVGDPDLARLRGGLAAPGGGLALDAFFALNPAMPNLHALYQQRQALIVHAVSTPYRGRSHFDGQDVLESGLPGVGRIRDGWLNRALSQLPSAGRTEPQKGLALSSVVPILMHGAAPVLTWSPKVYGRELTQSTVARLMDLYAQRDARLAAAFAEGLEIDRVAVTGGTAMAVPSSSGTMASGTLKAPAAGNTAAMPAAKLASMPPPATDAAMAKQAAAATTSPAAAAATTSATTPAQPPVVAAPMRGFVEAATTAAKFLAAPGGPRIGAMSVDGWDTHANEGVVTGNLANRLGGLDAGIKAFADGMGPAWKETVVVLVTEFGRTAAANGTAGTDHGTATVALLLGGAVRGGRVLADWPGLTDKALFEGRDLAPTTDLRAVLKGVLKDHLGLADPVLAETIFPDSAAVRPMAGLLG